jgi:hypothetical protein
VHKIAQKVHLFQHFRPLFIKTRANTIKKRKYRETLMSPPQVLVNKALNPIFHPKSHFYQVSNFTRKIPIFGPKTSISPRKFPLFPPLTPIFSAKIELCSTLSEIEGPFLGSSG